MSAPSLAGAEFWGRSGLVDLLGLLNGAGEEARVVGGAVRNTLLDLPVTDVDIATTALPQEVTRRVRKAGMKAVPTGIEHGTVTVVVEHHAYEVTTLREDTETDGRRAVVRFGRSWQHDAERRDFTMNALYATARGEVIDLVGGLNDLACQRVRFIGDAEARIREDHLRILRLFRFHAAYGLGAVDQAALTACVRLRAGLARLSRERVRTETLKLLMAEGAAPTLVTMSDAGLLQPILGGIGDLAAFRRLVSLESQWGVPAAALRRLGALGVRVREDAERLGERLRLSNKEGRRLLALAGPLPRNFEGVAGRAYIYRAGTEAALDRALIAAARGRDDLAALGRLVQSFEPPVFPLTAKDLLARGLRPGPALGAALARAEADWIGRDFPLDAANLAAIADTAAAGQGAEG